MSIVKAKSVQIGIDATAANNFALYVPTVADGTVRLGNGNSGSVTDLITVTAAGNVGIGTGTPSTKLQVSGTITATSFAGPISGLTSGRVTYAGTAGLLQDSANLTFNGTTLTSTGFAGPISGVVTSTSITDSGLTSGRVTYATTGGLLTDSANLTFNGSTLTTLNSAYTGTLTGGTGVVNLGSGQFYKDASGNVGIGTTSALSGVKLNVNGGVSTNALNVVGYGGFYNSLNHFGVDNYLGATRFYSNGSNASTLGSYDFHISSSDGSLDTTAMRIDSSGNVGIGTSSPACKLDINKGSAGLLANFTDGVNTNFQIETASLIATIGPSAGSTAMALKTGNTERMRIDSSGNVLVGTTTSLASEKLAVVGGNGIYCRTQYAITSTATSICNSAGCLLLLRDNANGQTALILYENSATPIIVFQTGTNYTTTTPIGTKIKLENKAGNLGVAASMASGQSTTLNVAVFSVQQN